MNDNTRRVLERVAEGVWCQQTNDFFAWSQCAFCSRSPQSDHDNDCPTLLARKELDNK